MFLSNLFKKESPKNDNILSYNVLTPKGEMPIESIKSGDKVYRFPDMELLTVKDRIEVKSHDVYLFMFPDGRSKRFLRSDLVYTGKSVVPVTDIISSSNRSSMFEPIPIQPVEYDDMDYIMYPDPYTAGVMIVYGDFSIPYVNIPKLFMNGEKLLRDDEHLIDWIPSKYDSMVMILTYNGKKVKWKTLFPNDDFYKSDSIIIPSRYKFSSIDDRIEFIHGVFDAGYIGNISGISPTTISIVNKNDKVLSGVKKILLSLGTLCNIEYNPKYKDFYGFSYVLTILADANNKYPDFLNDFESVSHIMKSKDIPVYKLPFEENVPKLIRSIKLDEYHSFNLSFENEHELFYTDSFLPHVSL